MTLKLAVVAVIVLLAIAFLAWLNRRLTIHTPLLVEPEPETEPLNALIIKQIEEILGAS